MKFSFKKLKYIHLKDVWDLCLILLSFLPGMVLKLFKRNIWLVSERENDAHDNGYWFYKYVREKHPEINAYYSISFKCKDYKEKIKPLGNAIRHGSFKHHIYFWAARKYISAHVGNGFPANLMCRIFLMKGFYFFKVYFLQHGIIKDIPLFLLREDNKIDYFVSAAERERKAIIKDLHYPEKKVICTGLCRYDNLNNFNVKKNQVLIMPTWRWWLQPEYGKNAENITEEIKKSFYFKNFKELFSNTKLINFAKDNNLSLVYFPHNQMQPFLNEFKKSCPNIICASYKDYNVQQALKESAFLITDYSSIFFDFAYMQKPMTYFQFDYDEFCKKHYPKGYFDYTLDGFGPISKTVDDVVENLINSFNNNFVMDEVYKKRADNFFAFRDNENCKRNFEMVLKNS